MQTIAVVQARTSSSRLPGKVMMPIVGTPMIIHQLWRVQRSKLIDKIILATSDNVSDDQLALLCERAGFNVFRGSLNNVLDRFQKAIAKEDYANIVRITGDCPLCDPKIIDDVIQNTALKKIASPEDISKTVLFLASDESNHISGETIFVTGGF